MRKTILYISSSLDGYIADADGKVSWIDQCDISEEAAGSYDRFIKNIDTVIMGWTTYNQIVTELSPDCWIYKGLQSYIVTHRKNTSTDDIFFTDENPSDLIARLKKCPGKDIWICGGASIANQLMASGQIDIIYLTILPVTLGAGIRLFQEGLPFSTYTLSNINRYDDVAELIYSRK